MTKKYLLIAAFLLLPTFSRAQVVAAGRGGNQQLYVGGIFSNFDPDYGYQRLYGAGAFADYYLSPRLGVEAEARFLRFHQLSNIHEDNYLIGPKISYRKRRYNFYGKALFGVARFNFPFNFAHGEYFDIEFGGGLDYRIAHRIYLRAEYDYQKWPQFVGPPDPTPVPLVNRPHGLTPNGFSIGASYRIF